MADRTAGCRSSLGATLGTGHTTPAARETGHRGLEAAPDEAAAARVLRQRIYTPVVPTWFNIGTNLWAQHGERLIGLMHRYPSLFPDIPNGAPVIGESAAGPHEKTFVTDHWGTVREFVFGGIDGMSKSYPIADWAALDSYVPPDPLTHAERVLRDWEALCAEAEANRRAGLLTRYYIGEFHERMYYLRGYQNHLTDLADEPPQLSRLIELILGFNERLIGKCLECGVNIFVFHDDLGNQRQLMMRPSTFRKWLKPGFARMWAPIKAAGQYVYLHSDGMIRDVLPDLLEIGLDIINPQVAVNGIDEIARIC